MLGRRLRLLRGACSRPTATTPSRCWPTSRGPTATSAWSASPTWASASCSSAQTQPPHLRAITPLSVIADTFRSTLYPGGILNDRLRRELGHRSGRARPSRPRTSGCKNRISGRRHDVRGQPDAAAAERRPADARSTTTPTTWPTAATSWRPARSSHKINVPTYHRRRVPGRADRRRTGRRCSRTSRPATKVRAYLTNGVHTESLAPQDLVRLMEFVDFYVGKRIPHVDPLVRLGAPSCGARPASSAARRSRCRPTGSPATRPTRQALAAYEAEPPDPGGVGERRRRAARASRMGTAESNYAAWPVPGTIATPLLPPARRPARRRRRRTIADGEPAGASSYVYDPSSKRDQHLRRRHRRRSGRPRPRSVRPRSTGTRSPRATRRATSPTPFTTDDGAGRRRAASTCGCGRPRPTPTSRSRSPRCGPTARRSTSRAAGSAPRTARSTPASPPTWPRSTPTPRPTPRRCRPASSCRCGSACSRSPT